LRSFSKLTSSSSVSASERSESLLGPEILNTEDLGLDLGEGETKSGSGGGDVLEGGGGGEGRVGGSGGEFLDEGVGVESVEVVDVSRGARED